MKVHVTFSSARAAVDHLRAEGFEVDVYSGEVPEPPEQLQVAASGSDGLLCTLFDKLDEEFFRAVSRSDQPRAIAQFGVGYDNIDIRAATEHGIQVTNTPDVLTDATAEMAIALMLAAARRLGEGERMVRSGNWRGWEPSQMLGQGITGNTLGIIGAGRIGTATALKSRGFEMRVIYAARHSNSILEEQLNAQRLPVGDVLREADFVSLHVSLNAETRHMIGKAELERMKPTAILINTARGAVIDEAALLDALRSKKIAAAGLDVYENEPRLMHGLTELPNVVLSPHLGSATHETRDKMARLAALNLTLALKGEKPPNPVNVPMPRP